MRTPQGALKLVVERPSGLLPPTGFQPLGGRDMNAIQAKSDNLIDTALRNTRGMRWSGDVAIWQILLQKSFWVPNEIFKEPLMRFTRGDVRDHIVSSKINHGPA